MPASLHVSSSAPATLGAIAGSLLPIRRAEELIGTLPGVVAVRIVPSSSGEIDEVHVITTSAVLPKQTVRNIESALLAQLGWRVNHKKISIAQSQDVPRAADAAAPGTGAVTAEALVLALPLKNARRLIVFDDVEVRRSRAHGVLCRVTLVRNGEKFVGEAEGSDVERSRVELAARGALCAILEATSGAGGAERSLALEGCKVMQAFEREFIFVSVAARNGRERTVLTGSCEVRDSAETSAVLAVLDATNRWIQFEK